MHIADVSALPPRCAFALVERSSLVGPEYVIRCDDSDRLVVALWRRRHVRLADAVLLQTHLLSYCAAGQASTVIHTNSEEHRLRPQAGSLILLRAGEQVRWSVDATDEVVHAHIYIAPSAIDAFLRRHAKGRKTLPMLRNLFDAQDPWLDGYFRMLLSECRRCADDSGAASDFLEQTRDLLIGHLLSTHADSGSSIVLRRTRISALRPRLVQRIADYVLADPCADASLEALAALVSMSVDHFSRAFQRATGQTPHQYVLERRLELASALLRDADEPVTRIAHRCGFVNAAHFSSTFHQHYGMTPSQYRQRH